MPSSRDEQHSGPLSADRSSRATGPETGCAGHRILSLPDFSGAYKSVGSGAHVRACASVSALGAARGNADGEHRNRRPSERVNTHPFDFAVRLDPERAIDPARVQVMESSTADACPATP